MAVANILRALLVLTFTTATAAGPFPEVFSPALVLKNEADQRVRLADWLGTAPIILTMAYTACDRSCPMTFRLLADLELRLKAAGQRASFLIISLDPDHDTPAELARFRRESHLEHSQWHFLRASTADTTAIAKLLGIDRSPMDDHIVHKFKVWVFDAKGSRVHVFDWHDRDAHTLDLNQLK